MLRPTLAILIALLVAQPATARTAPSPTAETPLIARAKLFGDPTMKSASISPDGKWLSWIAPNDGILNIWVAPVAAPTKARALTAATDRPIQRAAWSPDSLSLLYTKDSGGDENYLLYGVAAATGKQTAYTPFKNTRVDIIKTSHQVKDRILVGLNNRDARFHDAYSLDLASGKLTLLFQNDGYASFISDETLTLRGVAKARNDGGTDYFRIIDGKVESTPFAQVDLEDMFSTVPLQFSADGKTLYWNDSRGRDTAALVAQDFASGKSTVVAADPRADIAGGLFDAATGRAIGYEVEYLRRDTIALDQAIAPDLAFLKAEFKGNFRIVSRDDRNGQWVIDADPVVAPGSTWLYQRQGQHLTRLFTGRPELQGAPLVPMFAHEIKARDGLTLVSYLSLPKNVDPAGSGQPSRPVPMVLYVHGGPWDRDSYGYEARHQWLANRGYAVLSVNFRGSTGFGKNFVSQGDREWGGKMHDDLLDAVNWAVAQGITTPDKVAIFGHSYGGYATLAGMAFTPTTFACGVDLAGPSNLFTLLESLPPYWEAYKKQFYQRIGDPTTGAGRTLLGQRSPLNFAARIARPLLVGQGANDPRVKVAEAEQIAAAVSAHQVPMTYVVFPDEGHNFARAVNTIAFSAIAENFLAPCLGGRAEPVGASVQASSAQVKQGASFVPGLQQPPALNPSPPAKL